MTCPLIWSQPVSHDPVPQSLQRLIHIKEPHWEGEGGVTRSKGYQSIPMSAANYGHTHLFENCLFIFRVCCVYLCVVCMLRRLTGFPKYPR